MGQTAQADGKVPCKVLVVDDNRDAADSTALVLSLAAGFETVAVYTPDEAHRQAVLLSPDVILMDIGMPLKDGYQLGKELQTLFSACRILTVTGFADEDAVRRSQEAGFHGHLAKPVDPEELIRVVRSACEARKTSER